MQGGSLKKSEIDGHQRVVIEDISPEIDGGRFPIKRCINDEVLIEASIFADGHDALGAILKYRHSHTPEWAVVPFEFLDNDRWRAAFTVTELGEYLYTIHAWVDDFRSWRQNLARWIESKQEVATQLLIGAELVWAASEHAAPQDAQRLQFYSEELKKTQEKSAQVYALDTELLDLMTHYPSRGAITPYGKELKVTVDRKKAEYSSWYEVFPRSLGSPQQHGSFKDLIAHLPYIVEMGFDVIYFPPIHPIGNTNRKGKNNAAVAGSDDPGSPWGIGAAEGGHMALHPQLGTFDDFQLLLTKAKSHGIEIALDIALQCSPDHPYVKEHPQWFKHRPDGSIQYAENPPKKYQDIYPLNFQCEAWPALWEEWLRVILFWIKKGVQIFRIDNPHTKPFVFWEWLIATIKTNYPEVIFLAEAFTRPKIMDYLSKLGFSQSYTYFTWRNTKSELTEYITELHHTTRNEFFRPNFWPNTPDILNEYLQTGGRSAFIIRLVLAATLGSNYGIYGPAFELCVNIPIKTGSEEYLNSEKYEIKPWDFNQNNPIKSLIAHINTIRKENISLQSNKNFLFHSIDNNQLMSYSKHSKDKKNILVIVVNLDPHHTQSGFLNLPLDIFGINAEQNYLMHDLLSDTKYLWHSSRNYVELNPKKSSAHIFKVYAHIHHEEDFKG